MEKTFCKETVMKKLVATVMLLLALATVAEAGHRCHRVRHGSNCGQSCVQSGCSTVQTGVCTSCTSGCANGKCVVR